METALLARGARAQVNYSALAFFMKNQGLYKDVWAVLGRVWRGLPLELGWALETIPAGEHGKLKIELTDEQRHALLPLLGKMRFFREHELLAGNYDELHITGAKFASMVSRVRYVKNRLARGLSNPRLQIKIGRWVGIMGQRPRTDWQDGTVAEIYAGLTDKVKQHPWVIAQMELEYQLIEEDRAIAERGTDDPLPSRLWEGAFATEFELGILAFIAAYDGDVQVGDYQPAPPREKLPNVPEHTVAACTLVLPDGTEVLVLNAPAVIRLMGEPRPTTVSGTQYWLEFYTPVPGARIAVVSGRTHWYRVVGDFERLVHDTYPDVSVYGMAESAVDAAAVLNNALGELVWLMQKAYDEVRATL